MFHIKITLQRLSFIGLAILIVTATSSPAFADSPGQPVLDNVKIAITDTTCVNHPTDPDARTYTFNLEKSVWENEHFSWNPAVCVITPKVAPEYTYNTNTHLWDTALWEYQLSKNGYILVNESVATPPPLSLTHGGPVPVATSVKVIDTDSHVSVNNKIDSKSETGAATVRDNQQAGDAITGNAVSSVTSVNLIQSKASITSPGGTTFTKNIKDDVTGDFLVDPVAFAQPAGTNAGNQGNLQINQKVSASLRNDVTVQADSGSATVANNKQAGNATTGNASAVVDVLNLINSVVAANQSFLGTVNIYGNYNGNILVPANSLNTLITDDSGSPRTSTATVTPRDDKLVVTNNVDLVATSGNATVTGNGHSGNAISGDAFTKLMILNFSGRIVNAKNSLLVFVNVIGSWKGLIMDAPTGTTSAAISGGAGLVSGTGGSDVFAEGEQANRTVGTDVAQSINTSQSVTVTNNISAHATSGNASVTDNRAAGNAVTGKATAIVNIANIFNSSFSLSHWFGVLFINVFGTWIGNFGAAKPDAVVNSSTPPPRPDRSDTTKPAIVFSLTPATTAGKEMPDETSANLKDQQQYGNSVKNVGQVLSANKLATAVLESPTVHYKKRSHFFIATLPIILGAVGLSIVGGLCIRAMRRSMY